MNSRSAPNNSSMIGLGNLQAVVNASDQVTKTNKGFHGFAGLTAFDTATVNGGASCFNCTGSPPDQGLCVSDNYVMEAINLAMTVYSPTGARMAPIIPLYGFFKLSAIQFVFDVECFRDTGTGRWFINAAQIVVNPNGSFSGLAFDQIAVSQTRNPLGNYYLYQIPTVDNGSMGTPSNPGCPCFGDRPVIGTDANGYYVTTQEAGVFNHSTNNGAQVYAISKADLVSGDAPTVVHIDAGQVMVPYGGLTPTLQPAMNSPGQPYAKNAEFFLSSLCFNCGSFPVFGDNRLAIWALTSTDTLTWSTPKVSLAFSVIASEGYGFPYSVNQSRGERPLSEYLSKHVNPNNNLLEQLAGGDARMQMVTYADGLLWAAVTTPVLQSGYGIKDGIAYFVISPVLSENGGVDGKVVKQGYISFRGGDVMYPSVGVNSKGFGVVSFSLVATFTITTPGPTPPATNNTSMKKTEGIFPSAAYALINISGVGPIHIAAEGVGPVDDWTGYPALGNSSGAGFGTSRWGDYSWAVAAPNGHIWIASEYIPSGPRAFYANFGTFISQLRTN
ncbi:MAG: hypothetical protein OK457_07455 [Thaumarchaeota archaeon]|nr:hypothetical protein [Nitrososphaerota archaeon]